MAMSRVILERLQPLRFSPRGGVWGRELPLEPGFHLFHAPSGRGKTSLLRAIGGMPGICAGRVRLEAFPEGLRPFSVMDQGLSSLPSLSARDNLRLGLPGQETDESRAVALAQRLGIAACLDKAAGALSRGELQRLLALRVLLQESAWILLDEPCAHLDAENARTLLSLFLEAAAAGRPVIMTSLDPELEAWPEGAAGLISSWSLS